MARKTVAIGFVGATLDRMGKGAERWNKWRPSVGLCQQPDLLVDRLELIHGSDARDLGLSQRIKGDVEQVSPQTEVRLHEMPLRNPGTSRRCMARCMTSSAPTVSTPSTRTTWCTSPPVPTWRRSAGSCLPRRATCRRGWCRPRRAGAVRRIATPSAPIR